VLDIIGVVLAWQNGKKAAARGHSKGQWIVVSLALWFGGEIGGIIGGIAVLGRDRYGDANLGGAFVIGIACAAIGGTIAWQLVNRLKPAAWMTAAAAFMPTHSAPAGGLPVTDAPDPTHPVMGVIPEFQPVMIVAVAGEWAQVRAFNGWTGWADGRALVGPPVGARGPVW
jgi:hypothetical protein